MCYFIHIAIDHEHAATFGDSPPRGLHILPTSNASLERRLPSGFEIFAVMSGGCSCDLYRPTHPPSRSPNPIKLRTHYRKKGWSEAKIDRAIAQKINAHNRPTLKLGLRHDVVDLFDDIIGTGATVAFVIHWYSSDVSEERVTLHADQTQPIARLRSTIPEQDRWIWLGE